MTLTFTEKASYLQLVLEDCNTPIILFSPSRFRQSIYRLLPLV